jgi:hypothetical protein
MELDTVWSLVEVQIASEDFIAALTSQASLTLV